MNKQEFNLELNRQEQKLFAEIDGRSYEIEVSEPEPNVFLLKNDNKIYEIYVSPNDNSDEPLKVKIGTQDFEINIIDSKKLRGISAGDIATDGVVEIKTAMPGKIVRVLLEKDAEVKIGEGVIVVEAMKMQNEMKSPKDGVIREIKFNEGDTVNAGDVLVIIE